MKLTFQDFTSLPFAEWRAMWIDYVGDNASALDEAIHRHTYSRVGHVNSNLFGVVAVAERPIAFAHYFFHPSTYNLTDACTLEDLYVAPQARGQGVGRALIECVAARARESGACALHWKARESNTAAVSLYERIATRTGSISFKMVL